MYNFYKSTVNGCNNLYTFIRTPGWGCGFKKYIYFASKSVKIGKIIAPQAKSANFSRYRLIKRLKRDFGVRNSTNLKKMLLCPVVLFYTKKSPGWGFGWRFFAKIVPGGKKIN